MEQAVAPLAPWNEPAAHCSHDPMLALGATLPGVQLTGAVAPVGQKDPGGHASHSMVLFSPLAWPKRPSGHAKGSDVPFPQ